MRRQNHSARRWWMFLLFFSTTDVEQVGLQLSLESVQSHLWSLCSIEMVTRSWFGLWELVVGPSRLTWDADDLKQRQQERRVRRGSREQCAVLNITLLYTGRQWSFVRTRVMWSWRRASETNRAAAFWTDWRRLKRTSAAPVRRETLVMRQASSWMSFSRTIRHCSAIGWFRMSCYEQSVCQRLVNGHGVICRPNITRQRVVTGKFHGFQLISSAVKWRETDFIRTQL